MSSTDEEVITKRKVTMTNISALPDGGVAEMVAVDYVRPDHLDVYVEDARKNWQTVEVSEEPDAGPGGYHGVTAVPAHLSLPDAGVVYDATLGSDVAIALEKSAAKAAKAAKELEEAETVETEKES